MLDHFQTVASLTRSLFGLWLDVKILAHDTTGDAVKKYNEFPEIERYRAAEKLVNFATANPHSLTMDISAQRAFMMTRRENKKLPARRESATDTRSTGRDKTYVREHGA